MGKYHTIIPIFLFSIGLTAGNTYPFLRCSDFVNDTPEFALANYLDGWKIRYWKKSVEYTQLTWRSNQSDPSSVVESMYFNKKLLGSRIIDREIVGNTSIKIHTIIYYSFGGKIDSVKISPMVIREYAPYKPSINGKWGVNPISAMREEKITGQTYKPKIDYNSIIKYEYQSTEDVSYANANRFIYRALIPADPNNPLPDDLLLPTAKYIWEHTGRYLDEFTVYFFLPKEHLDPIVRDLPYAMFVFTSDGINNQIIHDSYLENSPWEKQMK